MGASVRARLLKIAQDRHHQFERVLTQYVLERLLYRLSQSNHRDQFVLKGAMLTTTWFSEPHRPTRDVDFLSFDAADPEALRQRFGDICRVAVIDDGVQFNAQGIKIEDIRKATDYGRLRLRIPANVGGAKWIAVVDLGFGDATEPDLEEVELPALLRSATPPFARLFTRNANRGKISRPGQNWSCQHAAEGFFRYVVNLSNPCSFRRAADSRDLGNIPAAPNPSSK